MYLPYVELGCGLGVTLLVMLGLFVVYQVFWLELLLLYRSWFGTDERFTGGSLYIYIYRVRTRCLKCLKYLNLTCQNDNFVVSSL